MASHDFDVLLYGATGYTGRLIAQELEARRINYAIAGRSADRLRKLSAALASKPATIILALDDHDGLVRACRWCDVVIHAAGPFIDLGPPLMRAAIEAGTHFLDITGEQAYLQWGHSMHEAATEAEVTVVNAMGFDVVPSDIAAALSVQHLDTVETVELGIATDAKISGGTRRSMAAGAGKAWYWQGNRLKSAAPGRFVRRFTFPADVPQGWLPRENGDRAIDNTDGQPIELDCIFVPWGDCVTAPRTTGAHTVKTYFATKTSTAKRIHRAWPLTTLATRTPLARRHMEKRAKPVGEGPTPDERKAGRFHIVAEAQGTDNRGHKVTHRSLVTGRDPYGLTATAVVHAAHLLSHQGAPHGVLTPTQAFPIVTLANALKRHGITWKGPLDP